MALENINNFTVLEMMILNSQNIVFVVMQIDKIMSNSELIYEEQSLGLKTEIP